MNQKNINEYLPLDIVEVAGDSNFIEISEGYYLARYVGGIKKEGKHGYFIRHKLEILVGEKALSETLFLYDSTDLKITPENKLGKMYKALAGEFIIGEKVNLKNLFGNGRNYCKVKIKPIKTKTNFIENKILEYLPITSPVKCEVEDITSL